MNDNERPIPPVVNDLLNLSQEQHDSLAKIEDHATLTDKLVADLARTESCDPRWWAIAKTSLQQALMDLRRAVLKPKEF